MKTFLLMLILLFSLMVVFTQDVLKKLSFENEFTVKRVNNFNFKIKPTLTKVGEQYQISFEVEDFCDVTIVVENKESGQIVKHLVSGLLGVNPPAPLQKDTKKQVLLYDGKDDNGRYLDPIDNFVIRVSLGVSPKFSKALFDFPMRRHSIERQLFAEVPEGVLVYDGGNNIDSLRLYNHSGDYIKTIYPISADKISEIGGLKWASLPDGTGKFPVKTNMQHTSFLETGSNYGHGNRIFTNYGKANDGKFGKAATFLAAKKGNIVLGMGYMARLTMNGDSGGRDLMGPAVGVLMKQTEKTSILCQPNAAAISPDGKKAYFTGFHANNYNVKPDKSGIIAMGWWTSFHHIYEMDIESNEPPKVFIGDPLKSGNDETHFNIPISMHIDEENRFYVCDYMNNRVQVFDSDKKLLKSVSVKYPAFVTVLPKSKEVMVVSHIISANEFKNSSPGNVPILIHNLGTFEKMSPGKVIGFPAGYIQGEGNYLYSGSGIGLGFCITDASGELRLWVSQEKLAESTITLGKIAAHNVKIWQLKGEKFELLRDFEQEVMKELPKTKPVFWSRLRIQVNPVSGDLYASNGEFSFYGKAFRELFKINTKSGKISMVKMPFEAEDFCFDNVGHLYIKSQDVIGRYNVDTMKEVPFDYGIETTTGVEYNAKRNSGSVVSGIKVPTIVEWHQGGIFVNLNGNIIVSGQYNPIAEEAAINKFEPDIYKGRPSPNHRLNNLIHIYDKFGKVIKNDVAQGLRDNYGVGLDLENNVYVMTGSTRLYDGKPYPNPTTGTLLKMPINESRCYMAGGPSPLPENQLPQRPQDMKGLWVQNASWLYGGVGFMGKGGENEVGCACWNSKFAFDYLNRSFAPELERYSIAILDSNGNLITRFGRYGNRDSMGAKSLKPVGGDEITMAHGAYLACHTDKFLYISDIVNDRIVEVKLDYASNAILSLPKSSNE